MQIPDLLLNLYDYLGKKRIVKQARRWRAHLNEHHHIDVVSDLGLEPRNSTKPISQKHTKWGLISQESTYKDKEVIKISVERKVEDVRKMK